MSDDGHGGSLNPDLTARRAFFDRISYRNAFAPCESPHVLAVYIGEDDEMVVKGRGFRPGQYAMVDGWFCEAEFVSGEEIRVRPPALIDRSGLLMIKEHPPVRAPSDQGRGPVTITGVTTSAGELIRCGEPLDLVVDFEVGFEAPVRLAHIELQYPDGNNHSATYRVTDKDNAAGRVAIGPWQIERGGYARVTVSLYDDAGAADYAESCFAVVPANPLQLYAYPVAYGPSNWRGAAEYRSSNDRYYCEARWVISNGNSYSVTVGPQVNCRVSDANLGELADFDFTITPTTIPANSSRTLYVYTWHGSSSDVFDLFRDHGDATIRYRVSTSDGEVEDSLVFVGAAQVGVTANFVGNFSWSEMLKIVDIIDTWSTGVYNDVDCIFSLDTPILEIPSSDSDWSRYRDIRVEEDKDGDCVDSDEADDMRDDWSAPSNYADRVDVFFVESFSGDACASSLGGFSPVDGPSGKGGDNSGVVIDVKDLNILTSSWGEQVMGIIIAHELGHYLGLKHSSASNNFMNASVGQNNTGITYNQWKKMRDHHFVRRLNP